MTMNFFHRVFVGCVTLLPLLGASAKAAEPNVVAGRSLGRVEIGFTRAQVHKALGRPDATLKLKSGLTDDVWKAKTTSVKTTKVGEYEHSTVVRHKIEVLYRKGRVIQIEATSPRFVTRGGLSTQTPLYVLDKSLNPKRFYTYGTPASVISGASMYYLDQVQTGIAFEYGPAQDIWSQNENSQTIIVHKKGIPVLPDQGYEFTSTEATVPYEN